MLLRILRFVGVGVASMALANSAWAANATTDASSMRVGGEFRADWSQSDNGWGKTDDFTPSSTSSIAVHEANLTVDGKINSKTEYRFEIHLAPTPNGASPAGVLTEGYGKHWFAKAFGMSIGRQRVAQGGWDQQHNDYYRVALGQYLTSALPFAWYEDMLAFHVAAGGDLTLQLVNDVTKADTGNYNKDAHPTFILSWMGDFNGIKPLVNIGTFDNQKSNYFDIGVSANMSGLMATLDFSQKTVAAPDPADEDKDLAHKTTGFSLWLGYDIKGSAMPWLYYSSMDVAQDVEGDEPKANSMIGETGVVFDDNGTTLGLGANLKMFGDNWEPYVALVQQSGKFYDAAGEEETKSEMSIKLGATGKI